MRVRLNGRNVSANQLAPDNGGAPIVQVLGPVPKLDVGWDGPTPAAKTEELLAAEGQYDVHVEERVVTTGARLTLRVLVGTVGRFCVRAPATGEVTPEGAAAAGGAVRVERPKDLKKPVWTISREPSADELVLGIYLKSDVAPGKPVNVPVF